MHHADSIGVYSSVPAAQLHACGDLLVPYIPSFDWGGNVPRMNGWRRGVGYDV